jgi:phosphoribosyl 1,2-cyclic phosphodiesterase
LIDTKVFGSGSSGNGYCVDDGQTQIMIEAGISYKHVAPGMGFDFSRVAGMLITHEHGDHSKYIQQFLDEATMPIFMSRGTAKALDLDEGYRLHTLLPFVPEQVGSWTITGFPVEHDAAEPMGFLLDDNEGQRLLYITDTNFVRYRFNHITQMIVEMNYAEDLIDDNRSSGRIIPKLVGRIRNSHFEMQDSLKFIDANKSTDLEGITLIHVSKNNGDPVRFAKVVKELTGVPVTVAGR